MANWVVMKITRTMLLMLVVPFIMLGVVYVTRQHRFYPSPTDEDLQIRALLLSADKVDVQVQYFQFPIGYLSDNAAVFKPTELDSVLTSLNTEQGTPQNADQEPAAVFYFYKNKKIIGGLRTSYSSTKSDWFFTMNTQKRNGVQRMLHPATVIRLRQFIALHPEITHELADCGAYIGENRS